MRSWDNLRMELNSEKSETILDYSIVKEEYEVETSSPLARDEKPSLQVKIVESEFFPCRGCPKIFRSRERLGLHMKVHKKLKRYSCNICKNKFTTLYYWNNHMKRHKMGLKFKCEMCELEFFTYKLKMRHIKQVHQGDSYVCKICNKEYTSMRYLRQHELNHTSQIQCYYCNKILVCKQSLLRHMRSFHRGLPFTYPACTICMKSFSDLDNLNEHTKIHADEEPFECAICGHRFLNKHGISVHMAKTHLRVRKPLQCLRCNKIFEQTATFLAHQEQMHNIRKPFECQVCSNKYRHQSHLAKHMRTHEQNRRDYTCKVCGLVLQYKKSLRNHERMHEKEAGETTCSFCKKFFTYKRQLVAHMERYHRYLECPYCEKKPGSQKFLDEHIRMHHKNPPKIKTEIDDPSEMIQQEDEAEKAVDISMMIKTEMTEITESNDVITIKTEPK